MSVISDNIEVPNAGIRGDCFQVQWAGRDVGRVESWLAVEQKPTPVSQIRNNYKHLSKQLMTHSKAWYNTGIFQMVRFLNA